MVIDVLNEQSRLPADELIPVLERAVITVLTMEGIEDGEVSLALVDDERIQALNEQYRGIAAPTDVLSFPLGEQPEIGLPHALGDVVISLQRAQAQAIAFGHTLAREAAFLAVHGTLHLLGYDHHTAEEERAMRGREEAALERLGLGR